jgi:hypothetical protein
MTKGKIITIVLAMALGASLIGVSLHARAKPSCLKGALVGGIAGHLAHHGVAGAVAGCVIGHHERKVEERKERERYHNNDDYVTGIP